MAIKISFFNLKGGVGKTTSAKNIAGCLSKYHNKKVLLVDCDFNESCSTGISCKNGSDENMMPEKEYPEIIITNIQDDYVEDMNKAIVKSDFPNLSLMPVTRRGMLQAEAEMRAEQQINTNALFEICFSEIESNFDYIIFDNGTDECKILYSTLGYVDYVLTPFDPDIDGISGFSFAQNILKKARRGNKKLKILGTFLIKYRRNTNLSKEINQIVESGFEGMYINTPIMLSDDVGNSRANEMPVCYYKPNSRVAKDFEDLTNEIVIRIAKDRGIPLTTEERREINKRKNEKCEINKKKTGRKNA